MIPLPSPPPPPLHPLAGLTALNSKTQPVEVPKRLAKRLRNFPGRFFGTEFSFCSIPKSEGLKFKSFWIFQLFHSLDPGKYSHKMLVWIPTSRFHINARYWNPITQISWCCFPTPCKRLEKDASIELGDSLKENTGAGSPNSLSTLTLLMRSENLRQNSIQKHSNNQTWKRCKYRTRRFFKGKHWARKSKALYQHWPY